MSSEKIQALEEQIFKLGCELRQLRKAQTGVEVPDYALQTLEGKVSLSDLFGERDKLLVIHNMGQGCRYCTLWGDGLNPFLPHLESIMSVVLVSRDEPATQRRFANSRGWRFRTASHGGGDYVVEQSVQAGAGNMPGAVSYERRGGKLFRLNACVFGPGDLYCSLWHLLGLAGVDTGDWTAQYSYWRRPDQLDDGGDNILD